MLRQFHALLLSENIEKFAVSTTPTIQSTIIKPVEDCPWSTRYPCSYISLMPSILQGMQSVHRIFLQHLVCGLTKKYYYYYGPNSLTGFGDRSSKCSFKNSSIFVFNSNFIFRPKVSPPSHPSPGPPARQMQTKAPQKPLSMGSLKGALFNNHLSLSLIVAC